MSSRKLQFSKFHVSLSALAAGCLILTSCGGGSPDGGPRATPQGTVSLDTLKVGAPEALFKDAVLTFVPKELAPGAKENEYMSRTFDKNGGQVVAHCMNGQCSRIFVHHVEKPIPKATAEESMKNLMPSNAGEPTKVTHDNKNPKNPVDFYEYAGGYRGSLIYSSPAKTDVITVAARYNAAKADAADAGKESATDKTASDEPAKSGGDKTASDEPAKSGGDKTASDEPAKSGGDKTKTE